MQYRDDSETSLRLEAPESKPETQIERPEAGDLALEVAREFLDNPEDYIQALGKLRQNVENLLKNRAQN